MSPGVATPWPAAPPIPIAKVCCIAPSPSGNQRSRDFRTFRSAGGPRSALAFWAHPRVPKCSQPRWTDSGQVSWPVLQIAYRTFQFGKQFVAQARKLDLRSEEHTSELQSHLNLVCRLLLEKK